MRMARNVTRSNDTKTYHLEIGGPRSFLKCQCPQPTTTDGNLRYPSNNCLPFFTTHHNHTPSQNNGPPYSSGSNSIPTGRRIEYLPQLTDEEWVILEQHHGCKRCHQFYVHDNKSCLNEWPDSSNYVLLTHKIA
jgi:hypothetical protein